MRIEVGLKVSPELDRCSKIFCQFFSNLCRHLGPIDQFTDLFFRGFNFFSQVLMTDAQGREKFFLKHFPWMDGARADIITSNDEGGSPIVSLFFFLTHLGGLPGLGINFFDETAFLQVIAVGADPLLSGEGRILGTNLFEIHWIVGGSQDSQDSP